MKKYAWFFVMLGLGWFLFAGDVVVVTTGPLTSGQEIHFRFDHAGSGGPGASFNWSFGDGGTVITDNNQAHHAFAGAGSFIVTCMFTIPGAPPDSGTATIMVVDNRRLSAQGGGFRAGVRVGFLAENFVTRGLRWDFGDGTVEAGPPNHGHVYVNPGSYQVKAFDFNGDTPFFSTCTVVIEADSRQLSASPPAPRANQSVAFSAQNFSGGGLRWDFGDGTIENGGPNQNHVFRQPGSFQVRASENTRANDEGVRLSIQVSADNRQVQWSPSPPRAGMVVRFNASQFAGGNLNWIFGDGKNASGAAAQDHVYTAAGNYELLVWESADGQEGAAKFNVAVQPDARQVSLASPSEIFEGSEALFEGRSFSSPNLIWDFGDGAPQRGGARLAHVFQRPGSFLVKVVEADTDNLPLEARFQVRGENRSLVLKSSLVFVNSEFEIEARNFRASSLRWDFGDGTIQPGGRLMKHRYARTGAFRVRVVDFAGRDGKFIEKNVQVDQDSRDVIVPAEIIAGEEMALQLQNAPPGPLQWKFSDGESRSGPDVRAKVFRQPGPHKIMIADPSGKYPPLEKTVQVVADVRSLNASAEFILPKETVAFTAVRFKGPGVRWDFGDGTVKENGALAESHVFPALGRYQVKAVDFGGRSSKVFSANVVVAETIPGFKVQAIELAFDNGKYYRVVAKNSTVPAFQLRFKAKGRSVLSGQFLLDGQSIGLFQLIVQENQTAVLAKSQMPVLPAIDLGLHELTFKFSSYSFSQRIPVIKYFVTDAGVIQIGSPAIDAKVPAGKPIELRWGTSREKGRFEIAISAVPFQFLEDRQVQWLAVENAGRYLFDPASYKTGDWVYWQVRMLSESGQVRTTSEIASFKLSE